ncbi:DUF4294 domain-containing protein [Owenweeksia hongkongensis]|uniref:DUF4294 domain-containing protein n=1 Tax=Owenweeksia hongkongensis TaxID=253245 RepID=UPI003A90F95B
MKNIVFGIFVTLSTLSVGLAQQNDSIVQYFTKNSKEALDAIIVDGDTIPILILDEVLLVDKPSFNSDEARRRYYILRRKVIKVYPYAVIAGNKLDSLNLQLAGISSKRKKKRYIKDFQDYLEGRFEDELKQLTRTEGQILSKLISRETGITTFELIDTYRSGWNAFWWNMAAAFYDIDLKIPYDPIGNEEDKLIENILQRSFINGLLKERVPITTLGPEDIGL